MNDYGEVFRRVLATRPEVRPFLACLCDRIDRHGAVPHSVTLGTNAPPPVYDMLATIFGPALRRDAAGKTHLTLSRFFAGMTTEQQDAWLTALYAALERTRQNRPEERAAQTATARRVCASLQQEFPALFPVWERLLERPAQVEDLSTQRGYQAAREELAARARLVLFLAGNEQPVGLSHLGARFFGNSKALRGTSLLRDIADWLLLLEGDEMPAGGTRELLGRYAVIDNPTAVKVTLSGPLHYRKHGEIFSWIAQLWQHGESATMSLDNLEGIDECWCDPALPHVITCENETPFYHLVRSRHAGVIIYTEGYPNLAVQRCLSLLPTACTPFDHWGDSD